MNRPAKTYALLWGLFLLGIHAYACLTFTLQHETDVVYGRNFGWKVDVGAVVVNQRNVKKTAFVPPLEKGITWVSKYGSVTFNQFSVEVPIGGMNEEGLVIESLVSTAEHPRTDHQAAINELQWIQYHLDTCKSVDEVIQSAKAVRISRYALNLHYYVSDPSGKSAAIEFIDGKMVCRTEERLPKKVLANSPYDQELESKTTDSRFERAAALIEQYDAQKNPVDYAFETLDKVAQGDFTKWQVVTCLSGRSISEHRKAER
ncbi:MAG: linear amide C-N hydrolase [Pontiellaceae bacterium]|nr:linear amide C-N hydrolase [Pontiellaceae bacterium]